MTVVRLLFSILIISLCSCQFLPKREGEPATVENKNPILTRDNEEKSLIVTTPLMSGAVKNLYNQAQEYYKNSNMQQAIASLERAHEIQLNSPQVTQLLAEIYLQIGDYKQAHYWASIATSNGPAKGKSCEKAWRILAFSAEQLGYFAQHSKAQQQKENCIVTQQARF
jgi:tetratricopeptide (TPR) repeat protein